MFASPAELDQDARMSVSQVTHEISQMTEEEQFHVAAYLQHLVDERQESHAKALSAANERMDCGQKVTWEELTARHEQLELQGR